MRSVFGVSSGNKCVGGSVLSSQGQVVHDSHAEQLARRGLLRLEKRRRRCSERNVFSLDISIDKSIVIERTSNRSSKRLTTSVSF